MGQTCLERVPCKNIAQKQFRNMSYKSVLEKTCVTQKQLVKRDAQSCFVTTFENENRRADACVMNVMETLLCLQGRGSYEGP